MTLDGSLSQREEISWPKMGILKWPLTSYSVLFAVAFALCMIGVYLVTRIDEVDHSGDDGQAEPSQDIPYFKQLKAIVTDEEYGRKFIVFTISMFVFHFGMNTTAS